METLEEAELGDKYLIATIDRDTNRGLMRRADRIHEYPAGRISNSVATIVGICDRKHLGAEDVVLFGWKRNANDVPGAYVRNGSDHREAYRYVFSADVDEYDFFYPVTRTFIAIERYPFKTKAIKHPDQKCSACDTLAPHDDPNQPDKSYVCIVCAINKELL